MGKPISRLEGVRFENRKDFSTQCIMGKRTLGLVARNLSGAQLGLSED